MTDGIQGSRRRRVGLFCIYTRSRGYTHTHTHTSYAAASNYSTRHNLRTGKEGDESQETHFLIIIEDPTRRRISLSLSPSLLRVPLGSAITEAWSLLTRISTQNQIHNAPRHSYSPANVYNNNNSKPKSASYHHHELLELGSVSSGPSWNMHEIDRYVPSSRPKQCRLIWNVIQPDVASAEANTTGFFVLFVSCMLIYACGWLVLRGGKTPLCDLILFSSRMLEGIWWWRLLLLCKLDGSPRLP